MTNPYGTNGAPPADDASAEEASLPFSVAGDDATTPPSGDDAVDPGEDSDASSAADASSTAPPEGAVPDGACPQPLAAGDLAIDELMIESVAGTGDYGEWLEVRSTLPCAADLRGLHGECPSGAKVRTFDVVDDLWIPPSGTFVVADSADPALDHQLPGTLIVWSGQPGDVLRNKGGTVTLQMGETLIDTLTFPSLKLTVGASVAFPVDCPPARRMDWTAWQTSTASWFPGFYGTPNAPNVDVQCP
jgi:hypothetical protein